MAKNFVAKNTGVSVISGKISKIADDKKSAVISVQVYDSASKSRKWEEVAITTDDTIEVSNGQFVTAMGFKRGTSVKVERLTSENACLSLEGTEVVCGEVLFANLNKELDKDGNPRKTQAGTDKKPHFDITIAVGQGAERETHTMKFYNFTTSDGRSVDNIGRYEKLFSNFDRNENPIYIAAVVDEGQAWVRTNKDTNGREWKNNMVSHMGANSIDVNYVNGKEKEQTNAQEQADPQQTATQETPQQTAAAPAPEQTPAPQQAAPVATNDGFEMDGLDLSGLDDLDNLDI